MEEAKKRKEKPGIIKQIRGRDPSLEVMQLINDRHACNAC